MSSNLQNKNILSKNFKKTVLIIMMEYKKFIRAVLNIIF